MFSQSTPQLLFNAQSMKDLLLGAKEKPSKATKPGAASARPPASQSMSAALIQSILRQETGNPNAKMPPATGRKKNGKRGGGGSGAFLPGQGSNKIIEQAINPLERARTMRKAQNSVHAFAPVFAYDQNTNISGDDVSYLERQFARVGTIVQQNAKKINDGYEQLLGDEQEAAEEAKGSSPDKQGASYAAATAAPEQGKQRFCVDDANLLLLFAGINEIDAEESERICMNSLVKTVQSRVAARTRENNANKDKTKSAPVDYAAKAEGFVTAEESGQSGINALKNKNMQHKDAVPQPAFEPADDELDFEVWSAGITASLRNKLLAGVLAERRGHVAGNFMDLAEQSSVMMHAMAPPRKRKVASRPGSSESGVGFDLEGAESMDFDPALSALFGESSVEEGGYMDGSMARRGSKSGMSGTLNKSSTHAKSMLDAGAGSFFNSQTVGDSSGLPPLRKVKSMVKFGDKSMSKSQVSKGGKGASKSNYMEKFGQKPTKSLGGAGGMSVDEVAALRAELQSTKDGLADLDYKVESNVAWIHSNCDVQTTVISERTKDRCRKMALDRLYMTIGGYFDSSLAYAFDRWRSANRFEEVSQLAVVYTRAKAIEKMTHSMSEALTRQYVKAWVPWLAMFSIERRWEQECGSMEIARVVRGFLGRRSALKKKQNIKARIIQCLARVRRAKKRVVHRRKFLRLYRAAKRMQEFFQFLVRRTRARRECDRRRELKIAKANYLAQRKQADSIQRQAEEKLRSEKNALRKKANAAASSVKSEGSKGRGAPKKGPSSPKSSPSKPGSATSSTRPAKKGAKPASASKKDKDARKHQGSPEPIPDFLRDEEENPPSNNTAPSTGQPYIPGKKKKKAASPERQPEPDPWADGFDDSPPIKPMGARAGEFDSPSIGRGPIITKEDALRMKAEAEKFLMDSDPEYAAMVTQREAMMQTAGTSPEKRFGSTTAAAAKQTPDKVDGDGHPVSRTDSTDSQGKSKGGMFSSISGGLFGKKAEASTPTPTSGSAAAVPAPSMGEDDDEDYLTPEQVAEQDRLKAIAEAERVKKEKEDTYIAAQEAKAKEIADAAQRKADALAKKDQIEFEKKEAIRLAKEAAEEAKMQAQREAEERTQKKLNAERAAKEAKELIAKEAQDAIERQKAEAAQREKEIAELKAKAKEEFAAEQAAKAPQPEVARPLSARLMDSFRNILTPRSASPTRPATAGKPNTARVDEEEEGSSSRPQSAFGSMFSSAVNVLTGSPEKGSATEQSGSPGKKTKGGKGPKDLSPIKTPVVKHQKFDPKTAVLIPQEIAVKRLQGQARRLKGVRKVSNRRELMIKEHARAGRYIVWAVVLMQRTARGRLGRKRFTAIRAAVDKALHELRVRSACKIQCAVRRRLAVVRCKQLWIDKGEAQKAAEWKKYQEDSGRLAKLKVLARGTPRHHADSDDDDKPDITTWGIDPEQVNEMDAKIRRMEELERNIEKKEEAMKKSQEESEKRAKELQQQLAKLEEKQLADEANRLMQMDMMKQAMGSGGPMQSGRSMMSTGGGGRGPGAPPSGRGPMSARGGRGGGGPGPPSARSQPGSARPSGAASVPQSARHSAPPTARSARDGAGIPPDAPRMTYEGQEWVQLFDPDEKAVYWYCEATQAAQWEEPGTPPEPLYDSGYDTEGAMTDYSTDYYSGAETDYSEYQGDSVWVEYWDESAQAKYWYNNETGEASWTKPDEVPGDEAAVPPANVPQSARDFPDEWVSYIDEATNQEYWYNSKTGETSWA